MKELKIEPGVVEYNLGGKVTVEFSPTDMNFVEKAINALMRGLKKQDDIEAEIKETDPESIFEYARSRDKEMRELVNDLFGKDVCTPLFGTMNTFARDKGLPLWCNVIMAVVDECVDNLPDEGKACKARIEKYTNKYHR